LVETGTLRRLAGVSNSWAKGDDQQKPRYRNPEHVTNSSVFSGLSLALIGNASAQKFPGRRAGPEAFSMRRQVGSRWRSRRTRLAMGF